MSEYNVDSFGKPYTYPYQPGGNVNIDSLVGSSGYLRNSILKSILSQINGPSMAGVTAAAGIDPLAQGFRQTNRQLQTAYGSRGLGQSGGLDYGLRMARGQYTGGVLGTEAGAAQTEDQRRMSLLNSLLALMQQDTNFQKQIGGAQLGQQQAGDAAGLLKLQNNLDLTHGIAILASIAAGGAAGAAGYGVGTSGATGGAGAGIGAFNALQSGNSIGGGGGGGGLNNYFQQAYNQPIQSNQPSSGGYQLHPGQDFQTIGRGTPGYYPTW